MFRILSDSYMHATGMHHFRHPSGNDIGRPAENSAPRQSRRASWLLTIRDVLRPSDPVSNSPKRSPGGDG